MRLPWNTVVDAFGFMRLSAARDKPLSQLQILNIPFDKLTSGALIMWLPTSGSLSQLKVPSISFGKLTSAILAITVQT